MHADHDALMGVARAELADLHGLHVADAAVTALAATLGALLRAVAWLRRSPAPHDRGPYRTGWRP